MRMFGWRGAVSVYAVLLMFAAGLLWRLPLQAIPCAASSDAQCRAKSTSPKRIREFRERSVAITFAAIAGLGTFILTGIGAHLLDLLAALGLSGGSVLAVGATFGVGQFAGRLTVVLWGHRVSPLRMNVLAAAALPVAFLAAAITRVEIAAAYVFAIAYGAGNGIATVTRGTMALVLFDAKTYGATVGRLIAPSFLLAATAPLVLALVTTRWGALGAVCLGLAVGVLILFLSCLLYLAARPHGASARARGR